MFEAYLSERGLAVPEHERDLGIGVRPEYLVEHDGESCLVEVKEFARESNPIQGSGSFTQEQTLKPIRGQIHEAARKLRRGRDLGFPLVVVLTDPNRALMGLLGPTEVIAAMHGDLMIRVPRSGPPEAATMTTGRNGELRNDHPYISVVTVFRCDRFSVPILPGPPPLRIAKPRVGSSNPCGRSEASKSGACLRAGGQYEELGPLFGPRSEQH